MNKKDYKEIAGIIKEGVSKCVGYTNYYDRRSLANDLANYFEREDLVGRSEEARKTLKINYGEFEFNRKQFLKDCGVQE